MDVLLIEPLGLELRLTLPGSAQGLTITTKTSMVVSEKSYGIATFPLTAENAYAISEWLKAHGVK